MFNNINVYLEGYKFTTFVIIRCLLSFLTTSIAHGVSVLRELLRVYSVLFGCNYIPCHIPHIIFLRVDYLVYLERQLQGTIQGTCTILSWKM